MANGETKIDEVCPLCKTTLRMPKYNPFNKLIMIRCVICDWVVSGRNGKTIQQLLNLGEEPVAEVSET